MPNACSPAKCRPDRSFGSIGRDLVVKKGISMIETLRDFVAKANELRIDFMVIGSFAMSAYGR